MAVPPVSDALPDADCSEDFVLALILSVRAMAPAKRSSRGRRALFNYILPFHAARNVPDAPRPASGGRGRAPASKAN